MKPRALLALLGVMALCLGVVVISSQARKTPSRIDPPAAPSPRKSEAPAVDVATQAGKKEALDVVSGLVGHVVDEGDRPVEGVHALDASKCDEVLAASDAGGRMVLREEQLQLHPFERVAVVRLEHPGFAPELVRLPRGIRSFRAVLGRPTVLMVRVVDKDRLPIPQAILQVFESDEGSSQIAAWYRDRPVDARGEVRIDDVRPGALVLRALAPGFEDARHIVVARAGERRDVTISMSKAKTLHVRVRDTSGTPVVGVAVLASHSGGGMSGPLVGNVVTHWTHKTDGEGRTRFSSIPISVTGVTLAVKSDHYGPTTQEVEMAAGDKEVEVLLNAGAHLAVEVVSSDGTSIECSLKLRDLEGDPFGKSVRKMAGTQHVFQGISAGKKVTLEVILGGTEVHREDLILAAEERRDLTVHLSPRVQVTLVARDPGGPVDGYFTVMWKRGLSEGTAPKLMEFYPGLLTTGGRATFLAHPGEYSVKFVPESASALDERILRFEEPATFEFEVPKGSSLEGVAVDSQGRPLDGFQFIWTSDSSYVVTRSGRDGRFIMRRLQNKPGVLRVATSGAKMDLYSGEIPNEPLRLTVPLGALNLTVLGSDGRPAPALILAFSPPGGATVTAYTDGEGRASLRVAPGTWKMRAYGEGASLESNMAEVQILAPGGSASVSLQLQAK